MLKKEGAVTFQQQKIATGMLAVQHFWCSEMTAAVILNKCTSGAFDLHGSCAFSQNCVEQASVTCSVAVRLLSSGLWV